MIRKTVNLLEEKQKNLAANNYRKRVAKTMNKKLYIYQKRKKNHDAKR